ncbi:Uncharacterised protein [Bordetella pertussis]|nr:Uncharacterised protein [Bordetella pertussis]
MRRQYGAGDGSDLTRDSGMAYLNIAKRST